MQSPDRNPPGNGSYRKMNDDRKVENGQETETEAFLQNVEDMLEIIVEDAEETVTR